jgi:hypothetical protein
VTLFEFLSRQINQAETEQRQKAVVEARSQRDGTPLSRISVQPVPSRVCRVEGRLARGARIDTGKKGGTRREGRGGDEALSARASKTDKLRPFHPSARRSFLSQADISAFLSQLAIAEMDAADRARLPRLAAIERRHCRDDVRRANCEAVEMLRREIIGDRVRRNRDEVILAACRAPIGPRCRSGHQSS